MTGMEVLERAKAGNYFRTPKTLLADMTLETYSQNVEAVQMTASFFFWQADDWLTGRVGDWLIVHEDERIEIMKDSLFQKRFHQEEGGE